MAQSPQFVCSCQEGSVKGQRTVTLSVRDPATNSASLVEVFCHGAHVTRWDEAGQSLLFLSEKAVLDGSKPIRGGIPLIFPQFGGLGPLPSHGFARNAEWAFLGSQADVDNNSIAAVFQLKDSEATKKVWPHSFESTYTVRLSGVAPSRLTCEWRVTNTDATPLTFSSALHTYFRVADAAQASVGVDQKDQSLQGVRFVDQLQQRKELVSAEPTVTFSGEVDRIYLHTPHPLAVHDPAGQRVTSIEKTGLPDAVIWNPWIDKTRGFADMAPEEYKQMVCVEAACINWEGGAAHGYKLQPGEVWTAILSMTSRPAL